MDNPSGAMKSARRISPGCTGASLRFRPAIGSSSVIVGQFNVVGVPVFPSKADAVLIVHADAVLPHPVTLQSFKAIAGRSPQICEAPRPMQQPQTAKRHARDAGPLPRGFPVKQFLSVMIAE